MPTPPPVPAPHPSGLRAVVTGGARGIGEDIARRLAADGCRIAILDRLGEEGRAVAASLDGHVLPVDLADPATTAAATDAAVALLGGLDVLVNCAGVFERGPLADTTVEAWDRIFAVNVRAMLVTMQRALPHLIGSGRGRIVNLASMAAKIGGADEAAYAASKAAVVALTRAAALEWGPHGITANSVCPGYIRTDMGAGTRTPADIAAWTARSPLGRLGAPRDVSALVAFLVSPDADYLTGQAFDVSGGMLAH